MAEEMGARLAAGALLLGCLPQGHAARTCGNAPRRMSRSRGGAAFDLLGMGNDVVDLRIDAPVCRPPDDLSPKAYFWLPIRLTLAEDLHNPYAE